MTMTNREMIVRLPKLHQAQQQIRNEAKRFNVVCCGVRMGKSKLGVRLCADAGLAGYPVGWFSPTYKMLEEIWTEFKVRLMPAIAHKDEQQKRLELVTGGVIDFWSLDSADAIRGRKYKIAVIDEAAIVPKLEYAWQNVILTRLTDYSGSAWFTSTPKGMNYFWQLFERGREAESDWKSWQMPTSVNPYISADAIESARRNMSERSFRQEYLAQFLPDGAGVFRNVRAVSTLPPQEPEPNAQYIIGVDWGRTNDETVCSVWHVGKRHEVFLDHYTGVPFNLQYERVLTLAKRYNDALVIAEANAAQDVHIEELARRGVRVMAFQTTNATKSIGVDKLAGALERGDVLLQADEGGILQMESFESDRTPSGLVKYSAPEGGHDDIPMARMIAFSGVADSGPVVLWE